MDDELTLEQLQKIIALNKIYSRVFDSGDFRVIISYDDIKDNNRLNDIKDGEGAIIENNLEAFIRRSGSLPYPGMHICGQEDSEEVANSYTIASSLPYVEIEGRGRIVIIVDIV